MQSTEVLIREGRSEDAASIMEMIRELAVFERAEHEVELTADDLKRDGFAKNKSFRVLVAETDQILVGMALFYPRYSTWKGKTLYLEDLLVRKEWRRKGIGRSLLTSLIRLSAEEDAARLEWQVLDWNETALAFYRKINVAFDNEWINCRLTRDDLQDLSKKL